jgi:hypothetical protein
LLLAAIFSVFGSGLQGEVVKVCTAAVISVTQYAFFPRLASSLGLSLRLGFWSGLLAALLPLKPGSDLRGDWEAPAAGALLVLSMAGVAETWKRRNLRVPRAVRQGACWGVALLVAPAFLGIYVATLVAGLVLLRPPTRRDYLRFTAVQTACAFCLLLPWIIWTSIQLGSPIVTRSNTGLELRLSNNDFAGPNEMDNFRAGLYHRYHPLQNIAEAEKVRDLGEIEYNRRAKAEAMSWIRDNPARFLELSLGRAKLFWFPKSDVYRSVLFSFLSLTSLAGALLLLKRDTRAGLVLLIPLLIQPLPHYFVHVNVRHKYPIDWIGPIGLAIVVPPVYSRRRATIEPRLTRFAPANQSGGPMRDPDGSTSFRERAS